jgi:hypothetical protein
MPRGSRLGGGVVGSEGPHARQAFSLSTMLSSRPPKRNVVHFPSIRTAVTPLGSPTDPAKFGDNSADTQLPLRPPRERSLNEAT